LLKALVRIVAKEDALVIPLERIGHEFTLLYWNQTIIFHLRQAAVLTKESEVIKSIRAAADQHKARYIKDLPSHAVAAIDHNMAKILTINVLDRFHAIKHTVIPLLFTWQYGESAIKLSPQAHYFLRANNATLELIANYWWASYLEKVNRFAPAIIEKVQRDGARRSALLKYLRILTAAGEDRCFYCDQAFSASRPVCVDHVLPWSFLLDDPLWDLVLACVPCNGSKSDRLPEKSFIDKLALTNQQRTKVLAPTSISPFIDDTQLFALYDAAVSLEWPGPWVPILGDTFTL
jgi:hypothetical protein